jgi:solute carrier family 25 citrate transporter 1
MAAALITPAPIQHVRSEQRAKSHSISPLASLFAGAVAGATEAAVTYPFDFAKTRTQLRSATPIGPLQVWRSTIASQGVSGIYAGCSVLIAGTALKAGVRFLAFDTIKDMLADDKGRLSTSRAILAGMGAGAAESLLALTPTERIKTAMIDDAKNAKRFRSAPHAMAVIVREQGVSGLYRGLLSTTLKQSATSAVRMGAYNFLKTQYAVQTGHAPQSAYSTFGMGAIAGVITVYATQPFDTIKTRSQSSQGEKFSNAARSVWQDSGIRGYWKGSSMRLGRLVLSGGIVFTVYEQITSFF